MVVVGQVSVQLVDPILEEKRDGGESDEKDRVQVDDELQETEATAELQKSRLATGMPDKMKRADKIPNAASGERERMANIRDY